MFFLYFILLFIIILLYYLEIISFALKEKNESVPSGACGNGNEWIAVVIGLFNTQWNTGDV